MDPCPPLEPTLQASRSTVEPTLLGLAEARAEPLEARFIDHFAVLRKLGEGGMGVVYAAYDERLARRVALKLIHGSDPARLVREAQALARVSHPHVVQIYAVGTYLNRVYVAMEYVEGPTLAAWLATPRDAAEILHVFVQAGTGLAAVHARGLVHRDFKPGNVIVGDDGRARVLDFGLARVDDPAEEPVPEDISGESMNTASLLGSPVTRTGTLLGTPAYMSPEQFMRAAVDPRSDQFSFCVALYEALYDRRPFVGATMAALAASVLRGEVTPPPPRPELAPQIPAAILRGLAPEPADRWPSMAELLDVLTAGRGQVAARVEARAGRSLAYTVAIAGAAVFVGVNLFTTPHELTPAAMTAYALLLALVALAALPALRARYREPGQRMLMHFGVTVVVLSVITRCFAWRAGQSMADMAATESLTMVAAYATMAVFLRAPLVLLNIPLLLGVLALVFELGVWPQLIALSWLATIPLTVIAWQRAAAARSRPRGVDTSHPSMSRGSMRPPSATDRPASVRPPG